MSESLSKDERTPGVKQLALIGCAHIHTPGFVKRLQARQDVRVTCVWDHDSERAARWAKELVQCN